MGRQWAVPRFAACMAATLTAAACTGSVGTRGGEGSSDITGPTAGPASEEATLEAAVSGLRRLTSYEYNNVVRDLLENNAAQAELLLPEDVPQPFDNDYRQQVASQALIEGAELLAADVATQLLADPEVRDRLVGCAPTGPGDEACLRSFIERFGRSALRRPLVEVEVDAILAGPDSPVALAIEADDFYFGVETVLQLMLQDPEFLYRVEVGRPVQGETELFELTDWEIASRLSFLLWGSTPSESLLDRAAAGGLTEEVAIRQTAESMLEDSRARTQVARFHSMWLGYESLLPRGVSLPDAMRAETEALLWRVVFDEQRPWTDVFVSDETFVTSELAQHYGLSGTGGGAGSWIGYGDSGRAGLLSHGSFLAVGARFGDTSPVQRGLTVRTRLFCQDIPPPPPTVDVDEPPVATDDAFCKEQRYAMHREGGCAGCHALIDPVGFGLEQYDAQGRFRTNEPDNTETPQDESQCTLSGQGELMNIGTFRGPAELAQLAVAEGLLEPCVTEQWYRFAVGRTDLDATDETALEALRGEILEGGLRFDELVLELVGRDAFRYRRQEAP